MIRPAQVYLVVAPLDMRWGAERLSSHVQHLLSRSPCDGTAYAFTNRDRSRLKLLAWDGTGVWLCQRRLHTGRFRWPEPGDAVHAMTTAEWDWLVAGVDWRRLSAPPPDHWRV